MSAKPAKTKTALPTATVDYSGLVGGVSELLEAARRASARTVNAFMTATYWEVGRRIVEFEQRGEKRAGYGEALLKRLAEDLTVSLGRGFSRRSLQDMRSLYQVFPPERIWRTLSAKSEVQPLKSAGVPIWQTPSAKSEPGQIRPTASNELAGAEMVPTPPASIAAPENRQTSSGIFQMPSGISATLSRKLSLEELRDLARAFPLPWSHYVLLISRARSPAAFAFYHTEALRGGWSVRQLQRQMDSQFYERTALSRNKAAMLTKGARPQPDDAVTAEEEIRHPLVLEFLGLRDEYSETDLTRLRLRTETKDQRLWPPISNLSVARLDVFESSFTIRDKRANLKLARAETWPAHNMFPQLRTLGVLQRRPGFSDCLSSSFVLLTKRTDALDRHHPPLAPTAGIRASRGALVARAAAGCVVDGLRERARR